MRSECAGGRTAHLDPAYSFVNRGRRGQHRLRQAAADCANPSLIALRPVIGRKSIIELPGVARFRQVERVRVR
ncbi:hypothetical protein NS14008_09820 [Nocardia seriolae]|nr:hypothetical protein NS14008_09820 [Nocardia seriolae]